jgi:hypothetical protein
MILARADRELREVVGELRDDTAVGVGVWIVHRSLRAWRRDAEPHPRVGA